MATEKKKKVKNTIDKNEKLGLHLHDEIVITGVWTDKVPARVVGFHPDGRPLVFIDNKISGKGSLDVSNYEEAINQTIIYNVKGDVEDGEGALWFLSNDEVQFEHQSALGLHLGDEVRLGRTNKGYLIEDDREWDTTGKYSPLEGTVIGFSIDPKTGFADKPLIGLSRQSQKFRRDTAKHDYYKEDCIAPQFRKKWSTEYTDSYLAGWVFINKDTKFELSTTVDGKQGVKTMSKDTTRPVLWDIVKSDASEAGYRIAAHQTSKATKAGILALLNKQGGSSNAIKAMSEMLDTEYGQAFISLLLGVGGSYAPFEFLKDPRAQKIMEEFRIQAMSGVGNALMSEVMELLVPVIMSAIASLPTSETQENARVAEHSEEIEEEYPNATTSKTMTA